MTDQKRKSTRNFNLQKPESSRKFDLSKEDVVPVSKVKKNQLIPIIIIGLLVLLVGGYFLMKQSPLTNEPSVQPITEGIVSDDSVVGVQEPTHVAIKEQSSEATGSNALTQRGQTADDVNNSTQQQSNSVIELPYKKGETYKVYQFPFGVSDYSQPNPELDKLADVMKQNPTIKISISAYTDNVGDANYNQALSEQRARAIRDYLVSKGVDQNRLVYKGKGISTQYGTNAENRRAEFILT